MSRLFIHFCLFCVGMGLASEACAQDAPAAESAPTAAAPFAADAADKETPAPAVDESEPKRQVFRTLLEILGYGGMGEREIGSMLSSYEAKLPKVQKEKWLELRSTLKPDKLENRILDVYEKHFTLHEAEAVLAFYRTEAGQKMARLTPLFTDEISRAVNSWRKDIVNELHRRLNETVGE